MRLRAQLDLTWALHATPEVTGITDTLRQPAAKYLESAEANLRENAGGATAWAFADLEPRRVALETGIARCDDAHAIGVCTGSRPA